MNGNKREMWVFAAASSALLLAEHYLFAALRPGAPWLMQPPVTYVTGLLTIGGVFSAWCLRRRMHEPALMFWALTCTGGAATIAAYFGDGWAVGDGSRAAAVAALGVVAAVVTVCLRLAWLVIELRRENATLRAQQAFQRNLRETRSEFEV